MLGNIFLKNGPEGKWQRFKKPHKGGSQQVPRWREPWQIRPCVLMVWNPFPKRGASTWTPAGGIAEAFREGVSQGDGPLMILSQTHNPRGRNPGHLSPQCLDPWSWFSFLAPFLPASVLRANGKIYSLSQKARFGKNGLCTSHFDQIDFVWLQSWKVLLTCPSTHKQP